MTALAIRGSRFQNGVSRIHGGVSSRICAPLWPQIDPQENPLSYITNGVHVPTFLAQEWADLFEKYLGLRLVPAHHRRTASGSAWTRSRIICSGACGSR